MWKGRAPHLPLLETSYLYMGHDGEREKENGRGGEGGREGGACGVFVCVSACLADCLPLSLFMFHGPAITQVLAFFSWAYTLASAYKNPIP